ncbi:prepilin peptidase [Streptomyces subrutilus]|uniref:Peptidase A24 n=1 Tax=Streptomyces subrutilus TaxID=36818 RepID=A0A1E5PVD2_9ACTN|nr:A24 family peptidase [Streptomyces subrutilus]OEJ33517.1 peptidase A24 [Streptomyces subrutilus]
MTVVVIVLAAGYGVGVGLLLPRAVWRLGVEAGEGWRERCPEGHVLPGWLGAARCRVPSGQAPPHTYGRRALPLAALTGTVCAALGAAVGPRPEAVVYVGLAPVLVLLALVDRAVHRLPDVLTLPLAAAAAAGLGAAALLPGAAGDWRRALFGGLLLATGYLALFLVNPAGMGFGDVKLALSLGVALGWYGWGVWAAGAFLGFLYGALYGLFLLLRGSATRGQGFAFGPFMAAGAFTGVLLAGFGA